MNITYAFVLGRPNPVEHYGASGEIDSVDRHLLIKLIAARGKSGRVSLFSHRFKDGNDMALIEDVNLKNSWSTDISSVMPDRSGYHSSPNSMTRGRNVIGS